MSKKMLLFSLLLFSLIVFGCSQADSAKVKTAEERLAEGDYSDTQTDHMVPINYSQVEQSIDFLLQAGNMIGDRHYDELEASVNKLERQGADVSGLREKLAKLAVAPRQGRENAEDGLIEKEIKDLENQFAIIKQNSWQASPEGYAEIKKKLDGLEGIDNGR